MLILGLFAVVFHFSENFQPAPSLAEDEILVSFIDVGQGDSILIRSRNNAVLIDGGEYAARQTVINEIRSADIEKLDYIVATHPHSDHIGGLPAVIQNFDVSQVLISRALNNTATFENLLNAIEENDIPMTVPSMGERYTAGIIELLVLGPVEHSRSIPYDNINNDSIVIKLIHGQTAFLFTGDAERDSERDIINDEKNLRAQVLKIGHHGSRTASSSGFLEAVNPQAAVISLGLNNTYGHPHPETLAALEGRGIPYILRTDELGTVSIITNGQQIKYLP